MMEYHDTKSAAHLLHEKLQFKSVEQWRLVLQNARNENRATSYRIPFKKKGGTVLYCRSDLEEYVEFEGSRRGLGGVKLPSRIAETLNAFGGTSTGRKLEVASVLPQRDETTGELFIQVITKNPLKVYRLEPSEAFDLARELAEAMKVIRGITNPSADRQADKYEVIADRVDGTTISRKVRNGD